MSGNLIKNFGLVGVGSQVQYGKGGAKLLATSTSFQALDPTGSTLVPFTVGTPQGVNDASPKIYVDDAAATLNTAILAVSGTLNTALSGAGLTTSGTYSADNAAQYIAGATSLYTADQALDAALFSTVGTLSTALLSAGFSTSGTYSPIGTYAIGSATSLKNAADLLDAALAAEQARALAAEQTLYSTIQTNSADSVSSLQSVLSLEASQRSDADASLIGSLTSEISRAEAAESLVSQAVANESTARQTADSSLANAISLETSARQTADTSLAMNIAAEIARATDAEGTLTTNLNAEVLRALAAEATLGANLAIETARAEAAEDTLGNDIRGERDRAEAVETSLAGSIAAEADARSTADTSLAASIVTEALARATADTSLASSITAEFARATDAETSLNTRIDGNFATIGSLDTRLATVEGSYINQDGSVAFTGDINANNHNLVNLADPQAPGDAVTLAYLNTKVGSLGSVFHFVGTIDGGADMAHPLDLSSLADHTGGAYYKVTTAGYFTDGTSTNGTLNVFLAQALDGLVKEPATGTLANPAWDVIGHVDSVISGVTNHITVGGSVDSGFTIDIDGNFVSQVNTNSANISTLTAGLAAEITRAETAETSLAGSIAANASAISTESTARQSADTSLDAALTAEIARATDAEGTLSASIVTEMTRAVGAEQSLATSIASLNQAALSSEATLQSAIITETGRAMAAETLLNGSIMQEASTARANEASIATALAGEVTARQSADTSLDAALTAEIGRAETAESSLQTQIDDLTTSSGGSNAAISAEVSRAVAAEATLLSDINAEMAARQTADSSLDAALSLEITRAMAAESLNASNLSAEITRAMAAEGSNTTAISDEATARQSADTSLAGAISDEATARQSADSSLAAALSSEVTRATAAEGTNATAIAAEMAARQTADASLLAELRTVETSVGLPVGGSFTAPTSTNYLGAITSVVGGLVSLDSQIKTVATTVANTSYDRIISGSTFTSVVASDANGIVFSTDVNGAAQQVGSIVGGNSTNAQFAFDVSTANAVKLVASNQAASGDVDIFLVPQGSGAVHIGNTGAGVLQGDDTQSLYVAGGTGGGSLFLSGASVSITDQAATAKNIATFTPTSGAGNYLDLANGTGSSTLSVQGSGNADLVLTPLGTGNVSASNTRVINVATPTNANDAATKGYVDTAVAGVVKSRIVSVTETTGTVNVGAPVTGNAMRVRVLVTSVFTAGAMITVGSTNNAAELMADAYIDESTVGAYFAEVSVLYSAATQLTVTVTAGSGSTGVAQVYVEYIS